MPASSLIGSRGARVRDWFAEPGAYVLVDGQFGSTGKGLFSAYIACAAEISPTIVTTNQGPNSGHTAFWKGEKIVTKQVPVSSVFLERMGSFPLTYLNAGAIISAGVLLNEANQWLRSWPIIHPQAAMVWNHHKEQDYKTTREIAGTGQGTGPALMEKLGRKKNGGNTARYVGFPNRPADWIPAGRTWDDFWHWNEDVVFVETAQGFSLGVNSSFYPHVTSRECTVMQALADARIPAQMLKRVAMVVRTFPIRVGNTEETSGACYPDQSELTWDAIGVEPERTTVTNRVRRVFTWSRDQFRGALAANRPDVLFLNFMNYLKPEDRPEFVAKVQEDYMKVMGKMPTCYYGFGPNLEDVRERYY